METPDRSPRDTGKPFFSRFRTIVRRTLFFGSVVLVNLAASLWLADLFWRMGFQKAHYPLLAIFVLLNGLLVLGSFHAIFGAFDMLTGRKRAVRITQLADGKTGPLHKRHAVVMPVYNEDSVRVCARIEAIYRSIEATGHLESFDFFILSDTRDLDLWVLEETSWTNLCRRLGGFGRIYYRRRKTNENRKAGNIGDFVRTWGGGYEAMLVLDADSLMDGADIVKMARVMEAYPRLGILQTPPKLIRGSSVFTRLQQFAMRLYGPLFIRGLNYWQLGGGSYWGHNALIRLKPFSEFCELPALPGREPFGGRILSHDFVEAALMVAEGWEVWLAWDIEGTYEEAPPTLVDHLIRDRRWCQGNLQHLWLIFARKLPFSVRMHLFMGIMAYLGSPLWFLFLLFGTWVAWDRYSSELSQLPFESYVDRWFHIDGIEPEPHPHRGDFRPAVPAENPRRHRRASSSPHPPLIRRHVSPSSPEPCSKPSSPCCSPPASWPPTPSWSSASCSAAPSAGATKTAKPTAPRGAMPSASTPSPPCSASSGPLVALKISPAFTAWMSPILLGLVLAAPVSVWTSRARYGRALAKRKILATPEELKPPDGHPPGRCRQRRRRSRARRRRRRPPRNHRRRGRSLRQRRPCFAAGTLRTHRRRRSPRRTLPHRRARPDCQKTNSPSYSILPPPC